MSKNIVRQDYKIDRKRREKRNEHPSKLLWFTGLSGSGKSTLANALETHLHQLGYYTYTLDGDNIRGGLNHDLGFSKRDREENLRRIGEIAKLFVDAGVLTLAAFISPLRANRNQIQSIVGKDDFLEIYVKADLETCEKRDVKGLYKKARAGEISNFTGISAPYEIPETPDITVDTSSQSLEEALDDLIKQLKSYFLLKKLK